MNNDAHLARIRAKREAGLARLSDPIRRFYERELCVGTDAQRVRQALWLIDYEREPVSVRRFTSDDRYLGRARMFPKLVDSLEKFFEGDYTVALLTGGIGWGKSTWAAIAMAYDIYKISCLRDPAVTFGMRSGSTLAFVNVSVTVDQARKVLFTGLGTLLQPSPYFQLVFPYDRKLKNMLSFPKGVVAYPATASTEGVLGEGIFSAAMDEANFMEITERSKRTVPGDSGPYDQAEATFNKLEGRIMSRTNQRGRIPGHIYVISSARYPGDFTERMEKKAGTPEGKHIFVLRYPSWGTRPKSVYLSGTFKVEVGDLTRRSRVLDTETDVNWERVIEVPKDFEARFRADTENSVRDFAGISTLSIQPFIVKREVIQRMFHQGRAHGLKHPFLPVDNDGNPLPVTLQQRDPYIERLVSEKLHWVERQKNNALGRPMFDEDGQAVMEKILYPVLYHAHIDLSKSKCSTGLVVCHVVGTKQCQRVTFVEGRLQESYEPKPIIWVDLALEIKAPPQGEVDIPRVRAVLYQLRKMGMEFGSVTFDTYGSQESVKTLKDAGYRADEYSLDTSKEGYEQLKEALYDERIWCYPHPVLQRELGQLEDTGKKIDHPNFPGASKDLADALAGAVHGCEEGWRAGEMIGGLFKIGAVEHPGELREELQRAMMEARAHVVAGQRLDGEDEDTLLFAPYVPDLLKTDKELFGHLYKQEDDDGTV